MIWTILILFASVTSHPWQQMPQTCYVYPAANGGFTEKCFYGPTELTSEPRAPEFPN